MRILSLTLTLALSSALAAPVTVTATGLPNGTTGTVTVGKVNTKLGGTVQLPNGTYTVSGAPIGVGAKVFVAKPVNVAVKGNTAAKLNYIKLPPGSPDPLFGANGQRTVRVPDMPSADHWVALSSGPDLPIITSAGSGDDNRQQLVSLSGTALGPAIPVRPQQTIYNRNITPLIKDGSGYLAGLSESLGTVIRYDNAGKQDTGWKTTPEVGPYIRGLLRLPDGGVLAYGGQTAPEVWKLSASGTADSKFGEGGRLSLSTVDPALDLGGFVKAARLMSDGRIRLVVINDALLSLMDLDTSGQVKLVSPAVRLPMAATSMDYVGNVKILADGSVYVMTLQNEQTQLVRVTSQGKIDPVFKAALTGNALGMAGIAIQPDGKVVAAYRTQDLDSRVLRYLPTGGLDRTFGNNGIVQIKEWLSGVEMGNDGKLYIVSSGLGEALNQKSSFVRITRLLTE